MTFESSPDHSMPSPRTRPLIRGGFTGLGIREALVALTAIAAAAALVHIVLLTSVHAPTVFSDELGYVELARSIGLKGHLALFNDRGLSYSPLYPVLLSPIFSVGASMPAAYALIKVVNAILLSLSVFPVYAIARFVLSRSHALTVAGVGAVAPLMFYSSFSMSENLAYPICLCAIWAMLAAIRMPTAQSDAALLGCCLLAALVRVELIVLVPAALTAVLLNALLAGEESSGRRLWRGVLQHRLLFGVVAAMLLAAGAAALTGAGVYSLLGRYAGAGHARLPNAWHFLDVLLRHVAGLDLAVGVAPFAAAVVATIAFGRRRFKGRVTAFAAVAFSVTAWLLVEVAYDAAVYDGRPDVPRIHERFLIYLVPFFLVALLSTVRIPENLASRRTYLAAAAAVSLLPLVIPFGTVVNQTIGFETFGLAPLAHVRHGMLVALPHAALVAVAGAAVFGFLFVHVRGQTRALVLLVLLPFMLISTFVLDRNASTSRFTRSQLPKQTDWVDAASPHGTVVLLTANANPLSALETAYSNLSVDRLVYLCFGVAGPEFGEQRATIDSAGRLRDSSGEIRASYVVAPTGLRVLGTVVARNRPGREVLVRVPDGRISVDRAATRCA